MVGGKVVSSQQYIVDKMLPYANVNHRTEQNLQMKVSKQRPELIADEIMEEEGENDDEWEATWMDLYNENQALKEQIMN